MKMFELLKAVSKMNKNKRPAEHRPLNLPEIPEDKFNPVEIAKMLKSGVVIWAWYNMVDHFSFTGFYNLTGGMIDSFALFRTEEDFLVKYIIDRQDDVFYAKIHEITYFRNSNVMELFNSELRDAYRVYYDDQGYSEQLNSYAHNITDAMVKKELTNSRVMYVTDDHFIRQAG